MRIPESMKEELGEWNNGDGVSLDVWTSCSGNFSLAVGYASLFMPKFIEYDGYILAYDEITDELISSIRGFEQQTGSNRKSVEWVLNHFHIIDLHRGSDDISLDKIVFLGNSLKEMYQARLNYLFPDKPCVVEFYIPDDKDWWEDYQLSFWQKKHEK